MFNAAVEKGICSPIYSGGNSLYSEYTLHPILVKSQIREEANSEYIV